ncbi:MAG: leucine-rich repeat protein [Bacteroidaceae bacterium]|nr:leucine-rich repeat protein [Bacteroidaceae bacterium]
MKQKTLKLMMVTLGVLLPLQLKAYDAQINGIYYNFNNTIATVTYGSSKYTGDLNIPSSITYNGNLYYVMGIGFEAFSGSTGLTSVTIPESVTNIGNNAFKGCSGLTDVAIPYGVKSIGYGVFQGCTGLISVTFPENMKTIPSSTFQGCTGLTSLTIPNSVTSIGDAAFAQCSGLTSVTIPNSVTTISTSAFNGCSSLTSIAIPNSVTTIGNNAFSGCTNLTSMTIPNSVTTIGEGALNWCISMTSVQISNSVTSIGWGTFKNCSSLTSVIIPESVISIGREAFADCSGLTSVTIGGSVMTIDRLAFYKCSNLTFIVLPNSLTTIEDQAFQSCSNLVSIIIPESMKSISNGVFYGCSNLTSVVSRIKEPFSFGNSAFNYISSDCVLTIPHGTKDAYIAAGWTEDIFKGGIVEEPAISTDEQLSVSEAATAPGKTVSVDILLENKTTDLTAYQFDLVLPTGFTLATDSKGKYQVTKTERYEDDSQNLSVSKTDDDTYKVLCFSMSNSVIEGNAGAILNVLLQTEADLEAGVYEGKIENVIFTKVDGTQLKLSDVTFSVEINPIVQGDANGDGEVNVADIVEIVNYVLGKPSAKFVFAASDLNADGEVNVTDIVKVVSIILSADGGSAKERRAEQDEMTDNDMLTLTKNGDDMLSLNLVNKGRYIASQFDVRLTDGQTLNGITLNSQRAGNHHVAYTEVEKDLYRVVVYSLGNSCYDGNDGELLNLSITGDNTGCVSVENILFVTSNQSEKRFDALSDEVTGISAIKTEGMSDIYSMDGRMVRKQATTTDGLPKGMYIINGKKQLVK